MNISITFKNFEPSDHLRAYAKRRFDKLNRFFPKSSIADVTVVLSVDKHRQQADVKVVGDGLNITAVEQSGDMYSSIDLVSDKVISQVKKYAEQLKDRRHSQAAGRALKMDTLNYYIEDSDDGKIVRGEEKFEPKPMYCDEAVLQLEQRNDDEFLVFLNAETDRVTILYRRKKGGFGLIDISQ